MKHVKSTIGLIIIALVLGGCFGAAPIRPDLGPAYAVAYGNISLPDDKYITSVMLYKVGEIYAPPFKSPPAGHTYTNGNFFFENLEPGKYFLMGFMSGQEAFYFNYRGIDPKEFMNNAAIDVKPGSVTYLGSYQVTGITRNFLKSDTFDIKPSKTPDKATILTYLKEVATGTGWDKRFSQTMKRK